MTLLRYCTRSQPGGGVTYCGQQCGMLGIISERASGARTEPACLTVVLPGADRASGPYAAIHLTWMRMGSRMTHTRWNSQGVAAKMMSSFAMPQRLPNSFRHGMAALAAQLGGLLQPDCSGRCSAHY